MKFSKDLLQELAWCKEDYSYTDTDGSVYEIVVNKIYDHSRWSLYFDLVFKVNNKYYSTPYSKGATESQNESPFEFEDDFIECREVIPTLKASVVYEPVEQE